MTLKLSLVGMFTTLENFCEAGKKSVMGTVGPLNTSQLTLFLEALQKTIELGNKIIYAYQTAQTILKSQDEDALQLINLARNQYNEELDDLYQNQEEYSEEESESESEEESDTDNDINHDPKTLN